MFDESNEPVRAGVTEDLDPSGPSPPADMDPPPLADLDPATKFFSPL